MGYSSFLLLSQQNDKNYKSAVYKHIWAVA